MAHCVPSVRRVPNGHTFGGAGSTTSATVVAVKDCLVLKIRREALEAASDGVQSRFDRQFIGILVNRLNNANERLAEASA